MSGIRLVAPIGAPAPPVPDVDDVQCMRRLVLGDAEALGHLIRKYWAPLVRYARRITGSADAAEDIAQDTFVALWRQRSEWQATASPRVYLYRIVRNLGLKEVRRRSVRDRWKHALQGQKRSVATPLDDVQREELRAALEAAIAQLPARRREAFILVRYQGMSLQDAAAIMEISAQTVANQVTAALADLRPLLAPFAGDQANGLMAGEPARRGALRASGKPRRSTEARNAPGARSPGRAVERPAPG